MTTTVPNVPFSLRELTVPQVLARQSSQRPDKLFLTELATGRRWTYRAFDQWVNRTANALAAAGASPGSHVGVLMANSAEHLAIFLALGKTGAVSVPVNVAARGDLLRYYFRHADTTLLIVDEALFPRLAEVLPELPLVRQVLVVGPAGGAATIAALPTQPVAVADLLQRVSAAPTSAPAAAASIKCSDLLTLAYTSGTTGPSKASMLSHAAALTYGAGAAEAQGYTDADIFYVCLPLFHNNALLAASGAALVCGGSIALSERFSASRFWDEVRASKATITNLLGSMSSFLWSQPARPDDADNHLRLISMSPPPKYTAEFEQRFGVRAMTNYGLSDFGVVTSFVPGAPADKLGSIGKPRRGFEVRIVDDDDFELPRGEVGEIALRSDQPWRAATGYYKMPEATLAAHRNQWFHTGDRGYCDADGYIWFVDRKKDCIRRRGENISAFEVEQVIAQHPAVAVAAAFPVRTADGDEEVGAGVVLRPGETLTPAALIEHCNQHMAYFMVPRYLQMLDELPMTINQKVEKFKLKQAMEAALDTVWDRERAGIVLKR